MFIFPNFLRYIYNNVTMCLRSLKYPTILREKSSDVLSSVILFHFYMTQFPVLHIQQCRTVYKNIEISSYASNKQSSVILFYFYMAQFPMLHIEICCTVFKNIGIFNYATNKQSSDILNV